MNIKILKITLFSLTVLGFLVIAAPSVSLTTNGSLLGSNIALAFGTSGNGGCCGVTNTFGWASGEGDHVPPVTPPTPPPPPTPAPSCTLSANPNSVTYNGTSNLSWTSTYAISATLGGVGSVAVNGSSSLANLTASNTYTLTVTGAGGSATCSAPIMVAPQPPAVPSCTLSASRTSVPQGEATTLSWNSQNTISALLSHFGSVQPTGYQTVYPSSSREYVLTVQGAGGSRTCSQYISVYTVPVAHPAPSCTLSLTKSAIERGQLATLQWNSYNAVSATINQFGGYMSLAGLRTVAPITTTQYYMTVRNAYGERATCSAQLGVYQTYTVPPPIQYIPISYVPYTGTDDLPYIFGLLGILLASIGGATLLYRKQLRCRS